MSAAAKDPRRVTHNDRLHEQNVAAGRNKYKTLKAIRAGSVKERAQMFEYM